MYQDKERGGFCPLFLLFITQSRYRQGRAQRACLGLACTGWSDTARPQTRNPFLRAGASTGAPSAHIGGTAACNAATAFSRAGLYLRPPQRKRRYNGAKPADRLGASSAREAGAPRKGAFAPRSFEQASAPQQRKKETLLTRMLYARQKTQRTRAAGTGAAQESEPRARLVVERGRGPRRPRSPKAPLSYGGLFGRTSTNAEKNKKGERLFLGQGRAQRACLGLAPKKT